MNKLDLTKQRRGTLKLLLLTSTFIGSTLLAGCGGGGGGSSTPTPTPTPVTPTPPLPDNPPTVSVDSRIMVSAGDSVSITASGEDADGDDISYSWIQLNGDSVTNSDGFDSDTASFSAPDVVDSIAFEVTATANGASDSATVLVVVVEHVSNAIFIDSGFNGTSDGSIDAPYKELSEILEQSMDDDADVDFYIKTPEDQTVFDLWQSSSRIIRQNISFYGGYFGDWERDSSSMRTPISTEFATGFRYASTEEYVEISGIDLTLTLESINNGDNALGIYGVGMSDLMVRENTITIADYPLDNSSGSIFGVMSDEVVSFELVNNSISTGAAPSSARDAFPNTTGDGDDGDDGSDASGRNGGNAGESNSFLSTYGGDGGDAGNGSNEDGDNGENANTFASNSWGVGGDGGNAPDDRTGKAGANGIDGSDGAAGDGGDGFGRFTNGGKFATSSGSSGKNGSFGSGGGGGGGGASSFLGFNGGGGGGGGQGGTGGSGGFGANSGGASIGVYVIDGTLNNIASNTIMTGNGGIGGIGGQGAEGGDGGSGGDGANGNSDNSGKGGRGGNGGDGGDGGIGGSGGGGPSFGVLINQDTFANVSNNQIVTGNGGTGGSALIAISNAAGKGGWSIGVFDANPDDASTPTVSGNTFIIGEAGQDGNPSSGSGTAANTNF